ncbi:MAG: DUF6188 family protein [Planctomycetes bacterium]|nr:DUF6188 family protein [Planctomycetota bacterium]
MCVGANEAILHFDPDISLTIESTFRVRTESGRDEVFEEHPPAALALVSLLSDSISDVVGLPEGTLRLSFARGGALEVFDSSQHYESYQIRHGKVIHVV